MRDWCLGVLKECVLSTGSCDFTQNCAIWHKLNSWRMFIKQCIAMIMVMAVLPRNSYLKKLPSKSFGTKIFFSHRCVLYHTIDAQMGNFQSKTCFRRNWWPSRRWNWPSRRCGPSSSGGQDGGKTGWHRSLQGWTVRDNPQGRQPQSRGRQVWGPRPVLNFEDLNSAAKWQLII